MQHQSTLQTYEQEQHLLGGVGGSQAAAPAPSPPPPTPPVPPAAPTQPTQQQSADVSQRLYAAQGPQSTVLAQNVNTSQGVVKKALLGG
jgi:hypothetical protein